MPVAAWGSPLYNYIASPLSRRSTRRPLVGAVVRTLPPTTAISSMSSNYNTITGTDTANTLIVDTSGDSVLALKGNDTVTGTGGNDIVDLGAGNDSLGQAGAFNGGSIFGAAGNDSIFTTNGLSNSSFEGGSENDEITIGDDAADDVVGSSSNVEGGTGYGSITITAKLTSSNVYGGAADVTTTDAADSIIVSGTASPVCSRQCWC